MASKVNPDLAVERTGASITPDVLSHSLYGGRASFERRQELARLVSSDPVFSPEGKFNLTREQEYERAFVINTHLVKRVRELGLSPDEAQVFYQQVSELAPLSGLHHSMFIPTIASQGTDEQKEKWLTLAMRYRIIGTYAQTEAGHGTFLRGIETTATFDEATDEFILETPTLTSMKWWPGSLGKTATHCVVMARLLLKGKDHGMHAFVLNIRSLDDHTLLPGVEAGDIGGKMGWNGYDNGYLKLSKVRIPRDQMLMRYAKVDREGNYTKPPHAKIAYGTMIYVRAGMVDDSYRGLSKAVTIAVRYSAVRRQGYGMGTSQKEEKATPEWKVLDYGLQQYSLFPLVAASYALRFASIYMLEMYHNLTESIKKGDFSTLAEVHATSSGLKAFSTLLCANGAEEARRRCGGHGYLRSSSLPDIVALVTPAITYEGEFQPILQQTARYLFRALHQLKTKGTLASGNAEYLNLIPQLSHQSPLKPQDASQLLDAQIQLDIYSHKAARLVENASLRLAELLKSGQSWPNAWNSIQPDLLAVVKAHVYRIYLTGFNRAIEKMIESGEHLVSSPNVTALTRLRDLFALYHLEHDIADLLVDGYLQPAHMEWIKSNIKTLLQQLRPDIVALVDAFAHSDQSLFNSALGRHDGNVYEALYEKAKAEPLNRHDVLPTYKYIAAFTKAKL
jgi:acyl-CoA oxidase